MSRSPKPKEIDAMPPDSSEDKEDLQVLITFFPKTFRTLHGYLVSGGWRYVRESYFNGHHVNFIYRAPVGRHILSLMYYRQRRGNYYCKFCIFDRTTLSLAEVTELVCTPKN